MGSYVLQNTPSDYALPPDLPYIWNPNNRSRSNSFTSSGGNTVSPVVIAVIGCLGAAFLIVSYYTMVARFCRARRILGRGRRDGDFNEADDQNVVVWPIFARGLQESVVRAIPVCKYSKSDGLVDGSECAVCLSEFEENESLRLLPKCNHAFHIPCIDKWLQSNSNCPLCRASIVSAIPLPVPSPPAPEAAATPAVEDNSARVAHALQEERVSENSLDQRSSEPIADDGLPSNWYHIFTRNGDLSAHVEETDTDSESRASSFRTKLCSKFTEGLHLASEGRFLGGGLRCFSTGRALMGLEEGRLQDEYQNRGRILLPIRRSSSVGTCSEFCAGLKASRGNRWSSVNLCQEAAAEAPRLLRSSSTVKLDIDLNNTSCSTSSSGPWRTFKSRSVSHGADLKSKTVLNDPVTAKMLFSLKGPMTVKRSFSGGRLFGFRVKNIADTTNARLPI